MTEPHRQQPHREPHARRGPLALIYRWLFDFEHRQGFAARFDYLIAVLIIVSVLSIIVEHIEAIHTPYAKWFDFLDWALIGIFTLEYLLRVGPRHDAPPSRAQRYRCRLFLCSRGALPRA